MTTLYRPVLIESAEQAEALPEGTVAIHAEYHPQEKYAGLWGRQRNTGAQIAQADGWMALVPIEAEEQSGAKGDGESEDFYLVRRLVTPWEEA